MNFRNTTLPQFILTINQRFVPEMSESGYRYGVVGFVLEVARELDRRNQLRGIIAYSRRAGLERPFLRTATMAGFRCLEYCFDFSITADLLRAEFARAVATLSEGEICSPATPLIIYHQTNVLLPITPDAIPFLITHHGPFASEVARLFGSEIASEAFQGGEAKLRHLIEFQRDGLEFLRDHPEGMALELSSVQEKVLRIHGVPPSRIRMIPPPLTRMSQCWSCDAKADGRRTSGTPLSLDKDGGCLRLVTATARPDAFKNLRQLTEAYTRLAESDIDVRLTIFTGGIDDEALRHQLRTTIPSHFQGAADILARLSHEELLRFFIHHRQQAIFVCTSLYETFGLTPMEAALHGMATLIPDLPSQIGAAAYFENHHRYRPDVDGLVAKLIDWHRTGAIPHIGSQQQASVARRVGVFECVESLCHAARGLIEDRRRSAGALSDYS